VTEPFVHETAVVDDGVSLGEGVRVWHFVHVSRGARIGARSILGQNVFIGPGVEIGAGTKIQNNVSVYNGVSIGEEVFLGPSCVFTNVMHPRAFVERKDEFADTHVGRGVTVGANAVIVCGHSLGEYAFIGAGAVVTKDVAPYALVVGNPARRIGWACQCGERLPAGDEPTCDRCGSRYEITDEQCRPKGTR
jgi:UDP-2-acetamido-3-amino-2,3-dideoxy-glucuronate N-acetyltransferase